MMNNRYPKPELMPMEAIELDYIRYMEKSGISAVEASLLCIGIIPKTDSALVFLDPLLLNAHEIFKLFLDAAQCKKIHNIKNEDGFFKAPLIDWGQYLISIKHPISAILLKFIKKSVRKQGNTLKNQSTKTSPKKLEQKREMLNAILNLIDVHFSKLPYKYYFYHPEITKLIKGENINEENFEVIASAAIKRPRTGGRPSLKVLDAYEKAHPEKEMQQWFAKIRTLMQ